MPQAEFYVIEVQDHVTRFYHLPPALPARDQEEVERIMNSGYDLAEGREAMQWVVEHRPDYEYAGDYRRFLIKWPVLHETKTAILEHRFDDALIRLDTLVTLDEEDPSAHYHLGLVFRYLYRFPDSESSLRRCLNLYPELAIGHRALGFTLAYLDKKLEAIQELETALQSLPNDPEIVAAIREIRSH